MLLAIFYYAKIVWKWGNNLNYTQYNDEILNLISDYLNFNECAITKEAVRSVTSCGVDELQAVSLLLASFINVNDKAFINEYFFDMLHKLESIVFKNDLYYRNISFKAQKLDDWELKCGFYKPYELFVQDDFIVKGEKIIPWLLFKIACPRGMPLTQNYKIIFWSFS